jgi:DNA-binding transcriptional MocR family regulator
MRLSAHGVARLLGAWQDGPGPAHQRLSDRLRLLVLDGRLALGAALPGERELAGALGVSRTTVGAAYRTLADHGYVATRERARATVRLPGAPPPRPPQLGDGAWGGAGAVTGAVPGVGSGAGGGPGVIDLSFAAPPAPVEILHAAYATALERLPRHFDRHGYDRYGVPELRQAVADWYGRRGLPTAADHVMVTNGAQHALALLTRALVPPRGKVVVDHPTYPHALTTFTAARARLVPVAVTPAGWDPAQLLAAGRDAALAYLIPDFHNPTGLSMTAAVRGRLRLGCPTVVDETMTDLALDGPAPEPFAAHVPSAISVGSVSKSVWGGLRTGWIRARPALLERVAQLRPTTDLGTPVVEQLATAALLDAGQTRRPQALRQLRLQREALLRALAERLPELEVAGAGAASAVDAGAGVTHPVGGVALWAAFPRPVSSRLAATAPDHGVAVAAGPRFGVGGAFARNIRLPYTLPPDLLGEAVRRLAAAHQALTRGHTGTHTPAPLA